MEKVCTFFFSFFFSSLSCFITEFALMDVLNGSQQAFRFSYDCKGKCLVLLLNGFPFFVRGKKKSGRIIFFLCSEYLLLII